MFLAFDFKPFTRFPTREGHKVFMLVIDIYTGSLWFLSMTDQSCFLAELTILINQMEAYLGHNRVVSQLFHDSAWTFVRNRAYRDFCEQRGKVDVPSPAFEQWRSTVERHMGLCLKGIRANSIQGNAPASEWAHNGRSWAVSKNRTAPSTAVRSRWPIEHRHFTCKEKWEEQANPDVTRTQYPFYSLCFKHLNQAEMVGVQSDPTAAVNLPCYNLGYNANERLYYLRGIHDGKLYKCLSGVTFHPNVFPARGHYRTDGTRITQDLSNDDLPAKWVNEPINEQGELLDSSPPSTESLNSSLEPAPSRRSKRMSMPSNKYMSNILILSSSLIGRKILPMSA